MTQTVAQAASKTASTNASTELQLVTFEVGNEEFAIDILTVREINRLMELTRVPQSPPDVEGVINLRGRIIPVIDLRRRFGLGEAKRDDKTCIVVVEVNKRVLGFLVDCVHEVLRISSDIVDQAPPMACGLRSDYVAGVAKLSDRLIILLDIEKLLGNDSTQALAA